jgi:hypothetical protein
VPPGGRGQREVSRRDFLRGAALGAGALLVGCGPAAQRRPAPTAGPARTQPDYTAGTESRLPQLDVFGTAYGMACAVGDRFAADLRAGFAARAAWFRDLKSFADSLPKTVEETFIAAAKKHTPDAWEELRGLAHGSGVPLRDLLLLNLNPELGALKGQQPAASCDLHPGCSTIVCKHGGRVILAHNEDGDAAYLGHMFMLRLHPTGKPLVVAASYPGILTGNAPWCNERDVVMTTNFITGKEVKLGVPRYFLDREAMGAASVDDALRICRNPERAYAFHHVITSLADGRAVSLEATPSRDSVVEIEGLFLHTNHLVHPAMAGEAQEVGTSTSSRWQVLTAWHAAQKDLKAVSIRTILEALTSHERKPYSPCRHPKGDVRGATLLTAIFDTSKRDQLRLYREQPCTRRFSDYPTARAESSRLR